MTKRAKIQIMDLIRAIGIVCVCILLFAESLLAKGEDFLANPEGIKKSIFSATMKKWTDEVYRYGVKRLSVKGQYPNRSDRVILFPKKYKKNYDTWLREVWGYQDRNPELKVKMY